MSVKHHKVNQSGLSSSEGDVENQSRIQQSANFDTSEKGLQETQRSSQQPFIPSQLKLLFVSDKRPIWVGLALGLDEIGCVEPRFDWVSTSEEALLLLRNDSYDCLLIGALYESKTRQLELLKAIRGSSCHDPVVLVLSEPDDHVALAAFEYQAEVLVSAAMWESPVLLGSIKRSIMIEQLREDKHRLMVENHRRLVRERDEAEQLLKQQRLMVEELQTLTFPNEVDTTETDLFLEKSRNHYDSRQVSESFQIPREVQDYYQELLRTYVIMGSGSLKDEILQISDLLSNANLTPRKVLEFHLECVELIIKGLGNRSSRHVMARADLLALEMMVHLGECYQKKSV
ncbi:hypothetical protein [Gimesia aquarii]|uniref:Response regulatory domain-containing protein n=1 Tax=Gimesia aquarii TaxID=2527964 RepID=A0A517WZ49_9PLAN|nr:hypothetical protein [Gimesia aquarii]QDU10528.1 hypothetical protein V202x_39400 [Gimesia aquarii]